MPLKYVPKVYLIFKLPDTTTHQGVFRQNQRLGEIVNAISPGGKTSFDQSKTIGELGLKNDTVVKVKRRQQWPFGR